MHLYMYYVYIVVCNRMIFCGIVLLLAIVLLRAYCLHNDAYWLTETQPRKKSIAKLGEKFALKFAVSPHTVCFQ